MALCRSRHPLQIRLTFQSLPLRIQSPLTIRQGLTSWQSWVAPSSADDRPGNRVARPEAGRSAPPRSGGDAVHTILPPARDPLEATGRPGTGWRELFWINPANKTNPVTYMSRSPQS